MKEAAKNSRLESKQPKATPGYRFNGFSIVSYEMMVQPHESFPDLMNFRYTHAPALAVSPDLSKAWVDFTVRLYEEARDETPERTYCKLHTRCEFGLSGFEMEKINEEVGKAYFSKIFIMNLFSIAISSTRGALTLISGGKFMLPIIDPSSYEIPDNIAPEAVDTL